MELHRFKDQQDSRKSEIPSIRIIDANLSSILIIKSDAAPGAEHGMAGDAFLDIFLSE